MTRTNAGEAIRRPYEERLCGKGGIGLARGWSTTPETDNGGGQI